MAREITIARFAEWISDESNVALVLEHVSGGMTLQKAAREIEQPYTCLRDYFTSTTELQERYVTARKAWADSVNDENIEIADTVKADRAEVAKAKLRIETRRNQAAAYNRERWGEQTDAPRGAPVVIQIANLRGAQLEVTTNAALPAPDLKLPLAGDGG